MKNGFRLFVLLLLAGFITACSQAKNKEASVEPKNSQEEILITPKVIYGDDDRIEVYQANAFWQQLSKSTVALVNQANVVQENNNSITLNGRHYGDSYGLCPTEPFRDQTSTAFCSGSLIGPDLILTAGHCIETQEECESTRFVFDFAVQSMGFLPNKTTADKVYSCARLVAQKIDRVTGADYAIVKIDRSVQDRPHLAVLRDRTPAVNEAITVIGHPAGIPTKVSGGANVRAILNGYYVANLDTYGGNSGSAVFTEQGLVAGILVRGERDFVREGNCTVSNRCTNTSCRGEDVTRVDILSSMIPE